jgi:8-oxo-dGTP pyrophosphatase MutT (NUDIX family)
VSQLSTLVLLLRGPAVLLALKKRGMGEGLWNGCGGKVNPFESAEAAAVREAFEEIGVGVSPQALELMAEMSFEYRGCEIPSWQMCVYVVREWDGEPAETEEMAPAWFQADALPLDDMWPDDRYWLPRVLRGERLRGHFVFDGQERIVSHTLNAMSDLQTACCASDP